MSKKRRLKSTFGGNDEPPQSQLHPSIGAIVESLARDTAERDFRELYQSSTDGRNPTDTGRFE